MTCRLRSKHYKHPMPHLFTARQRINGVETIHCTWCWTLRPSQHPIG